MLRRQRAKRPLALQPEASGGRHAAKEKRLRSVPGTKASWRGQCDLNAYRENPGRGPCERDSPGRPMIIQPSRLIRPNCWRHRSPDSPRRKNETVLRRNRSLSMTWKSTLRAPKFSRAGRKISLAAKELQLLEYLVLHRDRVLPREEI